MLKNVAERECCPPILHIDEGFQAQPTYNGLGRQWTNSLEDYNVQVVRSPAALPDFAYMNKTYAYILYNTNFL